MVDARNLIGHLFLCGVWGLLQAATKSHRVWCGTCMSLAWPILMTTLAPASSKRYAMAHVYHGAHVT